MLDKLVIIIDMQRDSICYIHSLAATSEWIPTLKPKARDCLVCDVLHFSIYDLDVQSLYMHRFTLQYRIV